MASNNTIIADSVALSNTAVEKTVTETPVVCQENDSGTSDVVTNTISNSTPMAVFPLNPSAKLDQEPNPFEQSFSTAAAKVTSTSSETTTQDTSLEKKQPLGSGSTSQTQNNVAAVSNAPNANRMLLPPVAAITSPAGPLMGTAVLPKDVVSHLAWDSLRSGPLSPSMLQGPANPSDIDSLNASCSIGNSSSFSTHATTATRQAQNTTFTTERPNAVGYLPDSVNSTYSSQNERLDSVNKIKAETNPQSAAGSINVQGISNGGAQDANFIQMPYEPKRSDSTRKSAQRKTRSRDPSSDESEDKHKKKQQKQSDKEHENDEDEKRRNFLERNRIAALKCRQRKKQWLNNLQSKVDMLTNDNEQLQMQTNALKAEVANLKALLYAHKDCPITQSSGLNQATFQKMIQQPGPLMTNDIGRSQDIQIVHHQPPSRSSFSGVSPTTTTTFAPAGHPVQSHHPSSALNTATVTVPLSTTAGHNSQGGNIQMTVPRPADSYTVVPSPPVRMQQDFGTFPGHPQPQRHGIAPGTTNVMRF